MIKLIASITEDNGIGKNNGLLFRLPEDMKRFKALTMYNTVIMGRKTYESIGKPLSNRRNIVITHQKIDGVECYDNIQDALDSVDNGDACIIGGESLYKQTIDIADTLELTQFAFKDPDTDAYFPQFDFADWDVYEQCPWTIGTGKDNGKDFTTLYRFITCMRKDVDDNNKINKIKNQFYEY